MVNNNDLINLIENKKPVELVQELEKYEIKKSPLSVAARSKVINKSGSDYLSENKGDYGPCPSGCYQRIRDGKVENVCYQTPVAVGGDSDYGKHCTCTGLSRFCLDIQCFSWLYNGGSRHACSASQALDYARDLENNNWDAANVISDEILLKCSILVRDAIRHYERGCRVKGYVRVQGRLWTGYEASHNY